MRRTLSKMSQGAVASCTKHKYLFTVCHKN